MRFFKSKPEPAAEATFQEKTESFWAWWADESDRILASVEGDGGATIQPEISAAVSELLIFDGDRSRQLIHPVMEDQGLQRHYQVESFTR